MFSKLLRLNIATTGTRFMGFLRNLMRPPMVALALRR